MTTPEQEAAQRKIREQSQAKITQLQKEVKALEQFRSAAREAYYQLSSAFQSMSRLHDTGVYSALEKARNRASRCIGKTQDEIADELEEE